MRQVSPGKVERSELMLWVATMGMHLGWRERAKNFSSPVGSFSPTVAKCWYSSQMKKTCRKYCSGFVSMFGMRFRTARWKSSFIMTPMALASPGFRETGKFKAQTLPASISSANGGSGRPYRPFSVELGVVALLRRTEGTLDHRVVVEQREEDRDAFDDGGAQLVLDPPPVVVEPALYAFENLRLQEDRPDSGGVSTWHS